MKNSSSAGSTGAIGVGAGILVICVLIVSGALLSFSANCVGGPISGQGPPPTPKAKKEIPPKYLKLYLEIGAKYKLPWALLASIGAQESDHGRGPGTNEINYAGCVGPMQIGVGGRCGCFACSYGADGDGDGKKDMLNPADAIATAANGLIKGKGAKPFPNGSRENYVQAMCGYYGACADGLANYAGEVEQRAAAYAGPDWWKPTGSFSVGGSECSENDATGPANLKKTVRVREPAKFVNLPRSTYAPGYGPIQIDARVAPNAVWLAKTYNLRYTAGRETGHASHGSGLALDIIPAPGKSWKETTERAARDIGWFPNCAGACMHTNYPEAFSRWVRWLGYNGAYCHGDPSGITGPCGPHLHIGWSGSSPDTPHLSGPMAWVDVFPSPGLP